MVLPFGGVTRLLIALQTLLAVVAVGSALCLHPDQTFPWLTLTPNPPSRKNTAPRPAASTKSAPALFLPRNPQRVPRKDRGAIPESRPRPGHGLRYAHRESPHANERQHPGGHSSCWHSEGETDRLEVRGYFANHGIHHDVATLWAGSTQVPARGVPDPGGASSNGHGPTAPGCLFLAPARAPAFWTFSRGTRSPF